MKIIQPNCRVQFTAPDMDFLLTVLGRKNSDAAVLVNLLTDESARDTILDDEHIFHALLERGGCLRVSTHFYFYILVRQVFRRAGLEDRNVADYVAEVLAEFAGAERTRCVAPGQPAPLEYFFEMLAAIPSADDRTAFQIRAHIGNYSLFLSGIFPERIRERAERRGFPNLKYYEALGRSQYGTASDHCLAHRYELTDVFHTLAERFGTTRLALNDIADRLFSLGEKDYGLEKLLHPGGNGEISGAV